MNNISKTLKATLDSKLWKAADKIIQLYKKQNFKITFVESIDSEFTYKPHIICSKRYEKIAIEIREKCNVESFFEKFVLGCQAKRIHVKLYFAVPEYINDEETLISHNQKNILEKRGIGLLIIRDKDIKEDLGTIACNRFFAIESGSSVGIHKKNLDQLVKEYNKGKCLSSIRDLSEMVELETFNLATKAAKKKTINLNVLNIQNNKYSWEDIINCLSSKDYKSNPQTRYFTPVFSNSIKEFKDVRNLSDHKKNAKQLKELEEKYPEAMIKGIRLLRELIKMKNKI